MSNPPPKAPVNLRELCERYNIKFKKALGQNLLLDDNINRIMTEAAGLNAEDDVFEVGSGLGALTRHLAARARRVLSVEIDASFLPCLEEQFGGLPQVRIFRGDILNHGLRDLAEEYMPGGTSYKMISNVPYYITTPLLQHFLESPLPFECMVVMLQEEVGARLTAPLNTADYGVMTVLAQARTEVDVVHPVPRTCFVPRPLVDSSIVRFRWRKEPLEIAPFLGKVVRAAFTHRRKTLYNSLVRSGAFGAPKEAVVEAMEASEIDPLRRPQTLSVEEFIRLAREIKKRL